MITGASELMSVEWLTSDGTSIGSATDNYVPSAGAIESDNVQKATLVVRKLAVDHDKIYTCSVTSGRYPTSQSSDKTVQLNVYGRFIITQRVSINGLNIINRIIESISSFSCLAFFDVIYF